MHELAERLGRVAALDPAADSLQSIVRPLQDTPVWPVLRGRWLGHSLHPMLTDVPIGLWTSAVVLDHIGGSEAERGADALVRLGILASVPTGIAGVADWSEASRKARRLGIVHASSNTIALVFFVASAMARPRNRARGRNLALVGEVMLLVGGYLGGHLAYSEGVGVDQRAAREPASTPLSPPSEPE